MRTTLTIDDDVLAAAKAIAQHQGKTIGDVVSELVRNSLTRPAATTMRNGFQVLPARSGGVPATLELVNALRDEAP